MKLSMTEIYLVAGYVDLAVFVNPTNKKTLDRVRI